MALFGKIKLGKTIVNGVKRALKINVKEETPDEDIHDGLAKAVKIIARAAAVIVVYKLFPDQAEMLFGYIFAG